MKPLVTIPGMLLVCGFIAPMVPQDQLPCGSVADFTAIGAGLCADLPVSFDVNAPDPGYTYTWDFGDGSTSSDFQPDTIEPNVHQCNGPRQFCGTVNVLRSSMNR